MWNGLGAALAAFAVMLQVLAPQGFMPGRTASGAPSLVICTGHGPLLKAGDLSGKTPSGKAHPACAFAGHGAAPLLQAGPQGPPARVAYALAAPASQAEAAAAQALAAPPPPATGPPVFA